MLQRYKDFFIFYLFSIKKALSQAFFLTKCNYHLPTYSILITTSPLRLSTFLTRSKSWRKSSWLLRTKPGA